MTTSVKWTKLTQYAIAFIGFVLVMYALTYITNQKFDKLQKADLDRPSITLAEREKQLDCLSQNIYYEAGHEPFEGKAAVGQIVLNRAASGRFPSSICAVVFQKNIIYEKVICQFSWVCETKSRIKPINNADYAESEEVAKKVLLEGFRLPSLNNALFYHASYISPGWNRKKITQIGQHIFYE